MFLSVCYRKENFQVKFPKYFFQYTDTFSESIPLITQSFLDISFRIFKKCLAIKFQNKYFQPLFMNLRIIF